MFIISIQMHSIYLVLLVKKLQCLLANLMMPTEIFIFTFKLKYVNCKKVFFENKMYYQI